MVVVLSGAPLADAFETFWTMYGKVGPRKKALQCFEAAVKRGNDPETIIVGLRKWLTYWEQPGAAAMKWPQGFLNQDYFLDEPPAVRVERKAMPGRGGIESALARRSSSNPFERARLAQQALELEGGES